MTIDPSPWSIQEVGNCPTFMTGCSILRSCNHDLQHFFCCFSGFALKTIVTWLTTVLKIGLVVWWLTTAMTYKRNSSSDFGHKSRTICILVLPYNQSSIQALSAIVLGLGLLIVPVPVLSWSCFACSTITFLCILGSRSSMIKYSLSLFQILTFLSALNMDLKLFLQ